TGCRGPEAVGGSGRETAQVVQDAEGEIRSARVMQEVLKRKGEILRYQLRLLEEEQNRWEFSDVPERREQWRRTRGELMVLLQDERAAEFRIREALQELWEAQDEATGWSRRYADAQRANAIVLAWPVDSIREISSSFLDSAYEERFGIPHEGMDIPVLQGTTVLAAADGIVRTVSDRGQGFNSLTLVHDDGLVTLYGHVSGFLVTEGQHVRQGDPIARSGGEPGTPGAGLLSTGQHLHFEVIVDGKHVDPLEYLQ
ncbi:M23 family metallopeptidase, partial [Candidatus Peregrinibacteria bacterium]|nr:M23 family metallopeptidase [Candidatus Peregrinibacteria bacterium]